MTGNEPDEELVARAVRGDREAFETLIRRHFRATWAVALAIMRDTSRAEDVCQDAFVRAWERLSQCRRPERFRGWLQSVARSVAHNTLQRERVRRTASLEVVAAVPSVDTPLRFARQRELREELLGAMECLSEAERTVLLLRDLEQWRHREVAEALEISENMSRRHLSDARRKMRERLLARGVR